ncbi:Gfo/Idh/MocA family protein [Microlunatus sp. Gsoil 973]|uniref:Gfo/Idh/MocA family protein n=1 Tax=Microlunatus sp. Gsoil 973 TaxID=2672569 RepID=UPI0012B4639E|nr:Gfo/Idh/MocA family oxidoreductase [Microlunatus sp. Gsoil 973]QGN32243.1 gfo/Idh/MocA family oxidoreductase [Microlunatus sp. Gsoil 973]
MTDTTPVRIAFVGAGGMANRVHYPSLAAEPGVEIVGLCDLDEARMAETADRYKIDKRFTDYRRMVDTVTPDAVYVIGQPEFMYPIWCWCLSQGLDLFVEKPLGLTLHQATNLAYLAETNNCVTQVDFQRRASPLLRYATEQLSGRGPVTHAVCTFYKFQPTPMLGARDHMMDDGVHAIDTLRAMCGGTVTHIDSVVRRLGTPDINFFSAQLIFDTGATGILINSWTSGRRAFQVQLHVPGGCAELDLEGTGRIFTDGDAEGSTTSAQRVSGSTDFHVYAGFQQKTSEFIRAVRTRVLPPSHFGDALETMRIAETVLHRSVLIDN